MDDWMTHVYGNDHTCMMNHVNVEHTMGEGQRYGVDMSVSCYMDYELMAGDHLITTCVFGQTPSASQVRCGLRKLMELETAALDVV